MSEDKFVAVCHPYDAIQAGLISSALEQVGIVCYVNNEGFAAVRSMTGSGVATMTLMVPQSQLEKAREVIVELGTE